MEVTTYEIGPSSDLSLVVDCGCFPVDLDTLYGGESYEKPIGETCANCGKQFFWEGQP